jgi:hypothetical protein
MTIYIKHIAHTLVPSTTKVFFGIPCSEKNGNLYQIEVEFNKTQGKPTLQGINCGTNNIFNVAIVVNFPIVNIGRGSSYIFPFCQTNHFMFA